MNTTKYKIGQTVLFRFVGEELPVIGTIRAISCCTGIYNSYRYKILPLSIDSYAWLIEEQDILCEATELAEALYEHI